MARKTPKIVLCSTCGEPFHGLSPCVEWKELTLLPTAEEARERAAEEQGLEAQLQMSRQRADRLERECQALADALIVARGAEERARSQAEAQQALATELVVDIRRALALLNSGRLPHNRSDGDCLRCDLDRILSRALEREPS